MTLNVHIFLYKELSGFGLIKYQAPQAANSLRWTSAQDRQRNDASQRQPYALQPFLLGYCNMALLERHEGPSGTRQWKHI